MQGNRTVSLAGGLMIVLALLLGSCNNPFQVGLGDKVDLDVPDVAMNDQHPAGSYLSGTVTLGGVYTDDFEISGITLSFDGGATLLDATLNRSDRTWEYEVNTADYPDGETEVLVTITDQSGKTIEKRILYYFDNTAPLVMVTNPLDYLYEYNGNMTVKGEAADQFGLSAVEYRLLNSSGSALTDFAEADGTSSWSALFDSRTYVSGAGEIQVEVRATDRAGNASATIVHYSDVLDRNNNTPITAEALVKILRGEAVSGAVITNSDLNAIAMDALPLQFDQTKDEPTFIISNPDENSPIGDNILSGAPRFTGSVEDDSEGVDTSSIQYQITSGNGSVVEQAWTDVTSTSGTGLLVRWTADVVGMTDGDYELQVRADDLGTASGVSQLVQFRINTGAPSITTSAPSQGTYVNGNFTITGQATDLQGVQDVNVSVDGGSSWLPANLDSPGATTVNWDILINPTTEGLSDGPLSVKVEATDGISTGTFNLQLVLDRSLPTGVINSPADTTSVNGQVTFRGTASDNSQVTLVEIRVGKTPAATYFDTGGLYNWEYVINSTAYANATYATDVGGNVWLLPVALRVTDVANNQREITGYSVYIDNDLDKPTASFINPSDGDRVAGPLTVTGTAVDDDGVDHVEMQIDVDNDGAYTSLVDLNGDLDTLDPYEDETTVYTLSGTTLWSQEINSAGELYAADSGSGIVTIKVWAVDIYATPGNAIERTITFDDTIPRADNVSHATGDYVSGTFTLTADIIDDTEVSAVKISYDGGQSYVNLVTAGAVTAEGVGNITKNSATDFDLHIDIDTSSTLPGLAGPITSDVLYLRLRVEDDANYQSLSYINLNVDNVFPTGSWDSGAADPQEIDGAAALLQGTAQDSGTISGVAGVDVYFVRGTDIFNFSTSAFVPAGSIDFGDGDNSVAYTPSGLADPDFLISIDDRDELGNDGGALGDGDGYDESLTLSGSTYTWYARFDSGGIPDGTVEIHYVINDSAGNAEHQVEAGFIKNNRPSITGITLGTNLDFSTQVGARVEADERTTYTSPFSIPALSVRDRLYVDIDASDDDLPGDLTYEVRRQSNDALLATVTGAFGTGAEVDVTTESEDTTVGLYVLVTDTDGIQTRQDFDIFIDNVDGDDPSATMDAITVASVVDGHVESATESTFDQAPNDADVSGTINITGSVSDNQRIQYLYLTIDGVETLVAQWDTGSGLLVEEVTVPELTLSNQTLDSASGHQVDFTYVWDSAQITNVADVDVVLGVRAVDFGGTTTDATDGYTVDVVPYISGLEIGLESGTLSYLHRSALGSYPIAYSDSGADTFRINGYNLDPGPGGVTIGANPLTEEAQDTTNFTWVDVRKNSLNSGELTVTTNGIDSINNTNNDGLTQNQEAASYYPDRTDDRYMAVWGLESQTAWSGKTEAIMRPNATRTNMDWYYVNNGQDIYFNNTRLTYSWSILGGDMARNDSGSLMWIYLHNMNWYSGQTAWDYWGSVQWGKDETYEAQAYNWHGANTDRLAVGNLSFDTDPNYPYTSVVLTRYLNLQILADGTDADTDNFVAYFDSAGESQSIVFWSFKTGTAVGGGTTMAGGWTSNLQKFTNGNTGQIYPAGDYRVGLRTPFTGVSRVELTSGGADSEHFDMAWDDANGILYIAYYDAANSQLKLAYNLDPVGTPAAWTTRATAIDTGAGQHVDATIDPSGGIHLAYFDGASSNLKYAYLPAYDALDSEVKTYTVDALFTNGMYNSIGIRDFDPTAGTDYRPVISSFSLSYSGTRYPVRVSWPTTAIGAIADGANTGTGNYTGAWEVMAVPAATTPGDSDSFIETDGATVHQGQIVVGYNGSYLEEATLYDE